MDVEEVFRGSVLWRQILGEEESTEAHDKIHAYRHINKYSLQQNVPQMVHVGANMLNKWNLYMYTYYRIFKNVEYNFAIECDKCFFRTSCGKENV